MGRIVLTAATVAIHAAGFAFAQSARYVVERHSARILQEDRTFSVVLKLDSASGDVWRFTGTEFVPVPIDDLPLAVVAQTPRAAMERYQQTTALCEKLGDIVIPELHLRSVTVRDAVDILRGASVQHDPDKRGINLVLALDDAPSTPGAFDGNAADPNPDPFCTNVGGTAVSRHPTITFSAKQATLRDILEVLGDYARLRLRIVGNIVALVPCDFLPEKLVHRRYDILPSTRIGLQKHHPELFEEDIPSAAQTDRWKRCLGDLGVDWPDGSSLTLAPVAGQIAVLNTYENLHTIERIFKAMDSYPPHPGRFRLVPADATASPALLLVDTDSGRVWQYDVSVIGEDGRSMMSDSFLRIYEAATPAAPVAPTLE